MTYIFSATTDFHSSLDTTKTVANTLLTPEALSPAALPTTNAISCACVVLLSGYFESYLRQLINEYIDNINSLGKPLSKLPYSMRALHYSGGANALQWAAKRDKELKVHTISQEFTERLASLGSPIGYKLAWESFANTKSNPGPDTVKALLAGLEVKGAWTAISDLSTQHGSLETFLTSFMKLRNICAHTGGHATPPTGADILDYVDRFKCLAECLDMMLALQYDEFSSL